MARAVSTKKKMNLAFFFASFPSGSRGSPGGAETDEDIPVRRGNGATNRRAHVRRNIEERPAPKGTSVCVFNIFIYCHIIVNIPTFVGRVGLIPAVAPLIHVT